MAFWWRWGVHWHTMVERAEWKGGRDRNNQMQLLCSNEWVLRFNRDGPRTGSTTCVQRINITRLKFLKTWNKQLALRASVWSIKILTEWLANRPDGLIVSELFSLLQVRDSDCPRGRLLPEPSPDLRVRAITVEPTRWYSLSLPPILIGSLQPSRLTKTRTFGEI